MESRPKHHARGKKHGAGSGEANLLSYHKRNEGIHAESAAGDVRRSRSGKDAHASDVVKQADQGDAEYRAILTGVGEARCPIAAKNLVGQKINHAP